MSQPWGHDPYQRRPVDINAYAPPKRGGGAWWLVALGVVLAGVVLAVVLLRPPPSPPASAPTQTPASQPTGAAGPGMPFAMPGSTQSHGRWEILEHTWESDGVIVRVRVTADSGRVTYGFAAFSNAGTSVYEPEDGAPDPQIGTGTLTAGQSVEGHLFLALPTGDSTLILTTEQGRQMSALPIPG